MNMVVVVDCLCRCIAMLVARVGKAKKTEDPMANLNWEGCPVGPSCTINNNKLHKKLYIIINIIIIIIIILFPIYYYYCIYL